MKVESITLDNIRSYDQTELDFENGSLLIYGDNGAGKSTLLQSIFGGLYQTDMLKHTDGDVTLDTLVRRTTDQGGIELTFSVGDDTYTVNWEITVSEDDGDIKGRTKSCTLEGGHLKSPAEGVKDVRQTINEIIGLEPESFVNSVYVQQGDITRLIKADGDKRKEIIDGLLGLRQLDDYIERMEEARRELKAKKREIDGRLSEQRSQLRTLPDSEDIKERLENLKKEKIDIEDDIEQWSENISELKERRDSYKETLDEIDELESSHEDAKRKYKETKQKHQEREQKREQAEAEREAIIQERETVQELLEDACAEFDLEPKESDVKAALDDAVDQRDELKTTVTKLQDGRLSTVENTIEQYETQLDELKDDISSCEDTIQLLEEKTSSINDEIEDVTSRIESTQKARESKRSAIDNLCEKIDLPTGASQEDLKSDHIPDARDELLNRAATVYEELGATEFEKDQYDTLVETSECPVCSETHEDTEDAFNHLDEMEDEIKTVKGKAEAMRNQRDRLDDVESMVDNLRDLDANIAAAKNEKEQIEQRYRDKQSQLNQSETEKDELEAEVEKARDKLSDAESEKESVKQELEDARKELENANERVNELDRIYSKFERVSDLDDEVEKRETSMEHHNEMRKEHREQMGEWKRKKESIEKEMEEKLAGRDKKDIQESYEEDSELLDEWKEAKSTCENNLDELRDDIAEAKQRLTQVKEVQERCNELEAEKVEASDRINDATDIIQSYKNVKTQLRQENIGLLNKYANEIFQAFYQNQTYQRLHIDEDYGITLITGDNVEIEPELSSGGEGTVVSLAIRAGVYRLLVERNGSTDTLPPFIMDEPTTFLDDAHVSQLQDVINTITSWDVPQVFIVSHNDNLIQNAEVAYHIEKDPATETSTVSVES